MTTFEYSPTNLLQTLIRFDTTNPPGNEYLAVNWARDILANAGIESMILAKEPNRPNLIARIKGAGTAPPLLLQGHVDVVTTKGQNWDHPPFCGDIIEGCIWGRGALDMKGAVSMMMSAFLQANHDALALPGDVVLCLLADEEAGGDFGAKYLVEDHPSIFDGVRFALGEAGGFSLRIAGKTFYPIMVAEKQICWTRITIRGPAGHGSLIHRNGAMARLGQILNTLNKKRLPVHITPSVRQMFSDIASALAFPTSNLVRLMLHPLFTDRLIGLLGNSGVLFEPLFHNTVNATIVQGGNKVNVIPSEITLDLDGRLLPGFSPDQMLSELRTLLGQDIEIEVVRHDPGPAEPDMGLFDTLGNILKGEDPDGYPIPLVMTGVTDARHFSKLGIQTYGFTPMKLTPELSFANLVHAANERIPVDCMTFGTRAILEVMNRVGEAK
jgi:acetylornithine deacetylase/succinyl-diaminopimelate desuccinylase-like protein